MGLDALILVFWTLNFKPAFSLSTWTLKLREGNQDGGYLEKLDVKN